MQAIPVIKQEKGPGAAGAQHLQGDSPDATPEEEQLVIDSCPSIDRNSTSKFSTLLEILQQRGLAKDKTAKWMRKLVLHLMNSNRLPSQPFKRKPKPAKPLNRTVKIEPLVPVKTESSLPLKAEPMKTEPQTSPDNSKNMSSVSDTNILHSWTVEEDNSLLSSFRIYKLNWHQILLHLQSQGLCTSCTETDVSNRWQELAMNAMLVANAIPSQSGESLAPEPTVGSVNAAAAQVDSIPINNVVTYSQEETSHDNVLAVAHDCYNILRPSQDQGELSSATSNHSGSYSDLPDAAPSVEKSNPLVSPTALATENDEPGAVYDYRSKSHRFSRSCPVALRFLDPDTHANPEMIQPPQSHSLNSGPEANSNPKKRHVNSNAAEPQPKTSRSTAPQPESYAHTEEEMSVEQKSPEHTHALIPDSIIQEADEDAVTDTEYGATNPLVFTFHESGRVFRSRPGMKQPAESPKRQQTIEFIQLLQQTSTRPVDGLVAAKAKELGFLCMSTKQNPFCINLPSPRPAFIWVARYLDVHLRSSAMAVIGIDYFVREDMFIDHLRRMYAPSKVRLL